MIVFVAPCPRCEQECKWEQTEGDGKTVIPGNFTVRCECS